MNYWIGWHTPKDHAFDLKTPWYVMDQYHGGDVICGAVKAEDVADAKAQIMACYVEPIGSIRFRFISLQAADWSPWDKPDDAPNDWEPGFPRADWMVW